MLACREDHCRLCWRQARLLEGLERAGRPGVDPRPYFEAISQTGQQLCLAAMWRSLQLVHPKWRYQQRHPGALEPFAVGVGARPQH
jgi:hypothetical protein